MSQKITEAHEQLRRAQSAVADQALLVIRDAKIHTMGASAVVEVDAADLTFLQEMLVKMVELETAWTVACTEHLRGQL